MEILKRCPLFKGKKCIEKECELFLELKSIDKEGKELPFFRCAVVETPLLIIELNRNIVNLTRDLLTKEK